MDGLVFRIVRSYISKQVDESGDASRHLLAWYNGVVEVITKNRDILGGTPVFRGTRVPIQTLFDYLEGGETLDEPDRVSYRFA